MDPLANPELIDITYRDQTTNKLSVFQPFGSTGTVCICLPGMGIRASYYKNFAAYLSTQGHTVLTIDWRGQGHSSQLASFQHNWGYEQLVSDLDDLVHFIHNRWPEKKIIFVGHSLGGQIASLYLSRFPLPENILVMIASCSVYWKGWEGWEAQRLKLVGTTFYPISRLFGYFPGNLFRFGGREARTIMKDWSTNVMTGKYQPADTAFDYEQALATTKARILSISLENDYLARKQAVINLLSKFGEDTMKTHLHLNAEEIKVPHLNHFNWAKLPEGIVGKALEWMDEVL
ncbi:MAG: alpha/beta fold hydrolase [Saprospiraceae bacterium]|nr:alpha/beta fold hydrolase [Lewinella sp.]